jgi:hypothetical protein
MHPRLCRGNPFCIAEASEYRVPKDCSKSDFLFRKSDSMGSANIGKLAIHTTTAIRQFDRELDPLEGTAVALREEELFRSALEPIRV